MGSPVVAGSDMRLTSRQQEVVQYMAWGFRAQEIAMRMGITYWTVKSHRGNAFQRLGARTSAHCVAIALQEGIIKGEPWEQS